MFTILQFTRQQNKLINFKFNFLFFTRTATDANKELECSYVNPQLTNILTDTMTCLCTSLKLHLTRQNQLRNYKIVVYHRGCVAHALNLIVQKFMRWKNDNDFLMNIALVRATNRCIRGSRIPTSNMSNRFRWEGGAGLGLLKSDN